MSRLVSRKSSVHVQNQDDLALANKPERAASADAHPRCPAFDSGRVLIVDGLAAYLSLEELEQWVRAHLALPDNTMVFSRAKFAEEVFLAV